MRSPTSVVAERSVLKSVSVPLKTNLPCVCPSSAIVLLIFSFLSPGRVSMASPGTYTLQESMLML